MDYHKVIHCVPSSWATWWRKQRRLNLQNVTVLMYAGDSVGRLSNPADVQAAFHSFIALCVRKQLTTNKNMKIRKRGKVARYEYKIFKGNKRHSTFELCPVTARGATIADIPFCRDNSRPAGATTNTARLSPRYEGKTRDSHCSHWAPDDGRENARNMLSCKQTSG